MESSSGIIVYEYEFIENLANSFSAELDEETLAMVLESVTSYVIENNSASNPSGYLR